MLGTQLRKLIVLPINVSLPSFIDTYIQIKEVIEIQAYFTCTRIPIQNETG